MRIAFAILLLSVQCFAAAYTASVTGNWNNSATWGGAGIPGSGDTVTINDGITVTIPVGYVATVGAAPADNTSTPAIQCAGGFSSSTGVLVNNGTLVYRGTVKTCAGNWSAGAGATFTHDSNSQSSVHYTFGGAGVGKLTLSGSSGSHITWNIAAGSGYAGTLGAVSTFTTNGQLHASYVDFSDIAAVVGGVAWSVAPYGSGAEFTCDHCTWTRSGRLSIENPIAEDAVISLTNSTLGVSGYNGTYTILDIQGITAKTGGTRVINGNYIEGGYVKWNGTSAGVASGFVLQDNFLYASSAGDYSPTVFGSNYVTFSGTDWNNNIVWTNVTSTTSFPASNFPGGAVNRTYTLYSSWMYPSSCNTVNYHPWGTIGGASVDIDQLFIEYDCGGPGVGSDGIQIPDGSVLAHINITNSITLPSAGSDGLSGDGYNGSVVSYVAPTATAPLISGHNNTINASFSTGACGFGTDGGTAAASLFGDIKDNIFYQPASRSGCAAGSSTSPANTYNGVQDYNAIYNVTGTYWKGSGTSLYSNTPGVHDRAVNPQFVDSTRNFLKWCQSLDNTITDWNGCRAKFQSHTAGFTPSALMDYVRAGFAPQNATIATMSSTGSYVGAVAPAVASSTMTITGATIKGVSVK